ncbi:MAG: helix-turn-helix domain-containing protein [Alphaproteobacteria bacterium]|nr:helix-turn-helix domain-containing protein [Alphaproteobacteria bacterium SS10]
MPIISATPIRIAIILFERTKLIDVCGPLQVFSDARTAAGDAAYQIDLVSITGGLVGTDTVTPLQTRPFSDFPAYPWDTVLVSGGNSAFAAAMDQELLAHLQTLATTTRRLGSICLGAFVLAAAGLLDGRQATTHWEGCEQLAADYPHINVQEDAIFTHDDGIWTSAGVTSGIDMALAMVEEDLGQAETLRLAKSLVLPTKRGGGQRQFSAALELQTTSSGTRFAGLVSDILADPAQPLTVPEMAAKVGMSERHFSRLFTAKLGVSPARFVERLRVEQACDLMHQSTLGLQTIQAQVGFSNGEQMRRAFQRVRGVSPSAYRQKFGAGPSAVPVSVD